MAISSHQQGIIRRANELGFFPTPAQAKSISALSCEEYAKRGGRGGRIDERLMQQAEDWAIRVVMERRALFSETLTGAADATLADQVRGALHRAAGKQVRVLIEEV